MREMQKVVVHYRGGATVRGRLRFFEGVRSAVTAEDLAGLPMTVPFDEIKAIFFVKEYEGSEEEHEAARPEGLPGARERGRPVAVRFADGEVIEGSVSPFPPTGPGFYLTPRGRHGNNRAIFVPSASALEIRPLAPAAE
jgi:hypothetical protein